MIDWKQVCKEQAKRIIELENLVAQLLKNSRNSHKPPSSDFFNHTKPKDKTDKKKAKNKIGVQKGHKQHIHKPFTDTPDNSIELKLDTCPDCGEPLAETTQPILSTQ